MAEFVCGAMPSPYDERDYQFHDIIAGVSPLPSTYVNPYLQELADKALNQGQTYECVCCSVAHATYLIERKQNGNTDMFAPSYLYGNKAEDDALDGGCYPRCVCSQAVKFGIPKFEYFPKWYMSKIQAFNEYHKNKERLDKLAYPYRKSSYYFCQDVDTIKRAIMLRGAVIACYEVFPSFMANTSSKIPYIGSSIVSYGYHEVTLVGWDDAQNSFIMLNSWGDLYNDLYGSGTKKPYCYIDYNYPIIESQTFVDDINEVIKEEIDMFIDTIGHWAEKDIDKVAEKGIVNGFDDGTFRPDEPLTRAQLCAILVRLGLV